MTAYTYDALGRLLTAGYPATTTTYGYDAVGNRLSQQVDANPAITSTSDATDQIATMSNVTGAIAGDKNGNLQKLGSPTRSDAFAYDMANRLVRTGPCRGDVDDNGASNVTDQQLIAGRLNAAEGDQDYELLADADGSLVINVIDLQLAAGEQGTCTSSGPNTGNGRYTYNGDGLRERSKTFPAAGTTTDDFVWDAGAALPNVLQDVQTRAGVTTTTTFVYGLGLISSTDNAGATSYYLSDGLGSTTQLTNSAGAVTDGYTYDVFGAPKTVTGTTSNDFRYTGQQDDRNANRGLQYLRARSYDPALGRFISRDPLPLMQRYAYAGNNPANFTDPSGQWSCCDLPTPSIQGISDWTERQLREARRGVVDPFVDVATSTADLVANSYYDANVTLGCHGWVFTGGIQLDKTGGYAYGGAGTGLCGASVALSVAPRQQVSEGRNCGGQISAPVAYGVGPLLNLGYGGITPNGYEGGRAFVTGTRFREWGLALGPLSVSGACYEVTNLWKW